MPVTVNISDRTQPAPAAAKLGDYADLREKSEGTKAFAIWLGLIFGLCALLAISEATRDLAIGIAIWWLLSVFAYFIIAPWLLLRRLRVHGSEYLVTSRNYPRLKALMSKGSALLGIAEPEAFVETESDFQLRMMGRKNPHFFVLSKTMLGNLSAEEMDFLVVRSLIHARENHASRLMLLWLLGDTAPAMRLLVWPVALYGTLLRLLWVEAAHRSADKLALLLRRDHKLLLAAILKQQILIDPEMQSRKVTSRDVDNYLRQEGVLHMEGAEVSTQYKLGQAIHENPTLEDRVNAINAWVKTPEYAAAVQKLGQARKTGPTPNPAVNQAGA